MRSDPQLEMALSYHSFDKANQRKESVRGSGTLGDVLVPHRSNPFHAV